MRKKTLNVSIITIDVPQGKKKSTLKPFFKKNQFEDDK